MKKYALLTSVLALAACGGGSGGGGSHGYTPSAAVLPNIPEVPVAMRGAVSTEMQESNASVTHMKSEVLVASNGSGISHIVRASSMPGDNGFTFTSYRLDDVKLFAADASTTDDGYLLLGLNEDTGRIENMKMVVGGNSENATPAMGRDAETSTFKAPILEYVLDEYVNGSDIAVNTLSEDPDTRKNELKDIKNAHPEWSNKGFWALEGEVYKYYKRGDEAVFRMVADSETTWDTLAAKETEKSLSGGHWNRTYEDMPVKTYGNGIDGEGVDGEGHSLQYSDFGHFNPVYETKRVYLTGGSEAGGWTHDADKGSYKENDKLAQELADEDYQLFAGGYAIKGGSMVSGERPSLEPVVGAQYKGMAIGRVYTSIEGDGDISEILTAYGVTGDGHDMAKAFTTHNATMEITREGGKVVQTLNMPFYTNPDDINNKYYDITIVKTGNVVGTPTFTATNEDDIEAQYQLHDAAAHWDTEHASFNPGYYGVDTPSEAAGTAAIRAGYEVHDAGNTISADRDYEVQAAYGLIKQ